MNNMLLYYEFDNFLIFFDSLFYFIF